MNVKVARLSSVSVIQTNTNSRILMFVYIKLKEKFMHFEMNRFIVYLAIINISIFKIRKFYKSIN